MFTLTPLPYDENALEPHISAETMSFHYGKHHNLVSFPSLPQGKNGIDRFIPVAEETGLIMPLGRWVARASCEQWIAWRNAGLNPPPV